MMEYLLEYVKDYGTWELEKIFLTSFITLYMQLTGSIYTFLSLRGSLDSLPNLLIAVLKLTYTYN